MVWAGDLGRGSWEDDGVWSGCTAQGLREPEASASVALSFPHEVEEMALQVIGLVFAVLGVSQGDNEYTFGARQALGSHLCTRLR